MRIAVVCWQFPTASETFIAAQVVDLVRRGHDVQVFSDPPAIQRAVQASVVRHGLLERTNYFSWPPVNPFKRAVRLALVLLRLAVARPRALVPALRHLGRVFDHEGARSYFDAAAIWRHAPFDLVLCHFGDVGTRMLPVFEAGMIRGKFAVVFHGADLSTVIAANGPDFYKPLFRRCDLVLPVSEHWARALVQYGCPPHKVRVHHMGVDTRKLQYRERRLAPGEPVRMISICRFVEKKGLEFAIRALARALPDCRHPVEYSLVGDGPLLPAIRALVEELGLAAQVRLLGWQDNDHVRELLATMHILVAPSVTAQDGDQEGIPVSIMEAMAAGLPVLSTRHSGIPELVIDGVSGWLAPERDVEFLADRMCALINAPDSWATLGQAGRAHVLEQFDQLSLDAQLERTIGEIVVPQEVSARIPS
jgi:colanic acid/amylovoran biosynthesis glycosyltransferase